MSILLDEIVEYTFYFVKIEMDWIPIIAKVVYRMLKYKGCSEHSRRLEYDPLSLTEYEKRYRDQQLKYLERKAAKFGLQLVPT